MLRYYVLCCRNMHALKRHLETIPTDMITFVINTLDSEFESEAVAYCQSEGVECVVTESNGTASQGKNSVIELFLKSSYDHFVLVDGDDYLTPHGVWTYNYIADMDEPPDVVALEYQYGLWRENGYGFAAIEMLGKNTEALANPYLGCTDPSNSKKIMAYPTRVFMQDKSWWEKAISGDLVRTFAGDDFSHRLNRAHHRWVSMAFKYISKWETHHRIVLCSRKACDGFRYDPEFPVGEDTLLYLRFKDAHVNGDLVVKHHYDRYPTYVYDTRVNGVVTENRHFDGVFDLGWCLWLESLADKFELMESEGIMHEDEVMPIINSEIVWPDGYIPDTLGAVNWPGNKKIIYS